MRAGFAPFAGLLLALAMCGAEQPLVIAHRGGMALRPQNTVAAFRHAASLGVPILELDMNVTADDRVVIHHDTSIHSGVCASPSVAAGPIRALTLAQILTFDCGSKRYGTYPRLALAPGARIPTLEDVLGEFRDSKVEFLAETKMEPDSSPHFVDPVKFVGLVDGIVRRFGMAERFILQSGDYRTIDEMRRRNPQVRTCLLNARRFKPDYVRVARQHKADYLMLHRRDVDLNGIRELHGAGVRVFSSTANTAEDWRTYLRLGMDGILTDDPEGLLGYLRSAGSGE